MVIAIDGYEANVSERVGIGRYAFEILTHMYGVVSQNAALQRQTTFKVYLPAAPLPHMPREMAWWKYRRAKPKPLWTFFGLPTALRKDTPPADVIFSPTHYVPRFISIPRVMAIMDLSFLAYPQMFRLTDLHKLTNWTAYGVRNAQKILTISTYSKNAIIKAYGVRPERVVVTYPGMTMGNVKNQKVKVLEKYHLSSPYILSVGTIQPRKNYVRLIEAFAKVLALVVSHYPHISLVIVGRKGWLYEETLEAPQRLGVADRVKFLEFVPDNDLPSLYAGALCFALPSLYEGFGLPVLEAMAYRCPVVVSDASSLPEVAGDAGIYVDPYDTQSIARGIMQALRERNTTQARERVRRGLAQVKKFSWEKAARQTLEVLTRVGKGEL